MDARNAGDGERLEEELELLRELEQNTPDAVVRQRAFSRLQIKVKVTVQPANTSEVRSLKVMGVTGDLSSGGTQLLLPVPLSVGDTYRLDFDRTMLDLPLTFGRCVRCRLIREDAFESGVAFFSAVELHEGMVHVDGGREAA